MFKQTIAVVDDDRNGAKLIGMLLGDEGYEVAIFNDPTFCLDALLDTHYDLFLVDYRMPQMNAKGFISLVKAPLDSTSYLQKGKS